jgi:N-acetylmuramoyl-L-alanine amidase
MRRLIVSAAHTSISPGSVYKDLREFDLTRKILGLVINHIEKHKIEYKAVPVDLILTDRIDWINNTGYTEENGDIFVEIHVNDGGKRGIESWYSGKKDDAENNSKIFTEFVQRELVAITKFDDQGAKSELDHELTSLLILNQTKPIAAAFELLYLDNEEDYKILKDEAKLDELAGNLVISIKKYLDNPPKLHPPKKPSSTPTPWGNIGATDFSAPFGDDLFGGGGGVGLPASDGNTSSSGNSNITMDRNQRKDMITSTYKKLLNRDPGQHELNQNLNAGISEEQMIKKIIDSKEFDDFIKKASDFDDTNQKLTALDADVQKYKSQINDLQAMQKQLQTLLDHKNNHIKEMQGELVRKGVTKPGEYYNSSN